MKAEQLVQRIGNVDERLVEEADRQPNGKPGKKHTALRRALAFAAAAALMAGSFSAGALVTKGGEKTIIQEKIVVKEPEAVAVGDTGISLILPESWAGKYGVREGVSEYGDTLEVYHLGVWEKYGESLDIGVLFRVGAKEGELPMDYDFGYEARVIAAKDGVTYVMSHPGGTIGITDDEVLLEWLTMRDELSQIKILLSDWLKGNSFNSTNWKEGTVTVQLHGKDKLKQFFCDEEHSKAIRELVLAQDYCLDLKSFHYDAWLFIGRTEYIVSLETGDIELNGSGRAQLSEEDLAKLKALLEEAENTSVSQPVS